MTLYLANTSSLCILHRIVKLYEKNYDEHLSVKVACDNCITSKPFVVVYWFHCLSSCKKSIRRRDFYLHFELIHENLILHSVSLPTLISTCPGRDRIRHESNDSLNHSMASTIPKEEPCGEDHVTLVHVSDNESMELLETFVRGLMLNGS